MPLLMLLEKIQAGNSLTSFETDLLESIELHLRTLVDVMGLYVECAKQPDLQMRRILARLEENLYGYIQTPEGRIVGNPNHAINKGEGQGAL